jgi:GH24 family phage-related lysozyme (muramidase)
VNAGSTDAVAIANGFKLWQNVNGKPNASIKSRRSREAALYLTK